MTLSAHHCAGLNQQEGRDVQAGLALLIRELAKGRAGKRRSTCEWPRRTGGLNFLHIFSLQDEPTNATGGTCGWPYSSLPCWHCKCLSLGPAKTSSGPGGEHVYLGGLLVCCSVMLGIGLWIWKRVGCCFLCTETGGGCCVWVRREGRGSRGQSDGDVWIGETRRVVRRLSLTGLFLFYVYI